jgi:hypothetical protein
MFLVNCSRLIIWFLLLCGVMQLGACTTKPDSATSHDDISDLNIDPDQKALPAEGALSVPLKGTDSPETIPDQLRADAKTEVTGDVPPTPTLDELRSGSSAPEPDSVAPEPPIYREADQTLASQEEVGSGPQSRFIKAAELNIREEPNRYSKIVGKLLGGQRVRVKIHGGWAQLDKKRWIRSRWLTKKPPKEFVTSDEGSSPQAARTKKKSKVGKSPLKKSNKRKRQSH